MKNIRFKKKTENEVGENKNVDIDKFIFKQLFLGQCEIGRNK